MTITNSTALDAYAQIALQTYLQEAPFDTGPTDPVTGAVGTYSEITQILNHWTGFQARAFFNSTNNEPVIAFTGTEGFADVNAPEFPPDFIADLSLAVAGASPQIGAEKC